MQEIVQKLNKLHKVAKIMIRDETKTNYRRIGKKSQKYLLSENAKL